VNTQLNSGLSIKVTAAAAIASGDPVLVGSLVGIAANKYAIGDTAVVWLVGTHLVPKAAEAWAIGVKLYWDSTNKVFTSTAGSNTLAGYAYQAALIGDAKGYIILRQ